MDDTRINDEMPFMLDRVSRMEQNPEEYRADPAKNEVEANTGQTCHRRERDVTVIFDDGTDR